jgi:hypothetical protein
MSKRIFQIIAGCAFALASLSLWAGFGGLTRNDAGASGIATAEWTPDLKSPDLKAEPFLTNAAFPQTLARPLFSPTRKPPEARPPEPVVAQPPQSLAPPPQMPSLSADGFVLKGVFIDEERELALLQTPAAPQGVWLATGAEVEGWTVSRIDKQGVAIEANGEVQTLTLYVDKPAN